LALEYHRGLGSDALHDERCGGCRGGGKDRVGGVVGGGRGFFESP